MCAICDKYKSRTIDGKQALMAISDAIKLTKDPGNLIRLEKHMFELSEIILSREVPEIDRDLDLESKWSRETYGDNE